MKLISRKLILGVLIILIVSSIAAFFLIDNYIQYYIIDKVKLDLIDLSYSIQQDVYNISQEYGSSLSSGDTIRFLSNDISNRYNLKSWIKINNEIIGIEESSFIYGSELFYEAIDTAFSNKNFFRISPSNQSHDKIIMHFPIYTGLYEGVEPAGVIGLSYPFIDEYQLINDIRLVVFGILIIFNIFVVGFIIIYFNNLLSPLTKLKLAMSRFQKGNYNEKLIIETEDELEDLAKSFNNMRDRIENLINRLEMEKSKQKNFYDNMTHELKTPLTIIKGYMDMYEKVNDEKTKKRCLEHVKNESDRMLRLVNNLLQRSKFKEYDSHINKERIELKDLIEETLSIIEIKAIRKDIELNFDYDKGIYLYVDADKIKEVLLNILDNAIKYSNTDIIDILLDNKVKPTIIIRDKGVGINEATLEKILNSERRDYYSTERGIGLKISKEIINLHDGEFEIISEEGKGTEVKISLPEA